MASEPLLLEGGDRLRQQYFSDIIERDICERVGARSVVALKQIVVTTDRGVTPIQVSWDPPADRQPRALEEFYETFPQAGEALLLGPAESRADRRGE